MDEADQIVQSKKRLLIGAVHIWNVTATPTPSLP
jgi:hypothetical protein